MTITETPDGFSSNGATIARCNLCPDEETAFRVPWGDRLGSEVMRAHIDGHTSSNKGTS